MTSGTDLEIQVMASVYTELRRLNTQARKRVLAWVLARIEHERGKSGARSEGDQVK
jgi:hypothetical protein